MFASILSLFALSAGAPLCAMADLPCQADHFAKTYHIRRAEHGANQVRVYRTAAWGAGAAWIVFPSEKHPTHRGEAKVVVDSTAFTELTKLKQLNGSTIGCGTKDGVGYVIDGYVAGDRSTFTANNPLACDTPDAEAINSALATLPKDNDGKD